MKVVPMDEHNRRLVENTHPPDWKNPDPEPVYNLVVIGGGTAGLVTSAAAASLGAKVALVEKHLLGGDCLNVGCVPSKAIIRSSRIISDMVNGKQFGIHVNGHPESDFPAVMERMRRIRSEISRHDSAKRFSGLGVDLFLGEGTFSGRNSIEVDGKSLKFKKAVIATGARAYEPPIDGLKEAGFLTNETVFSLTGEPGRMAVIGAGPIGCELAQAFNRLGWDVSLFNYHSKIMAREDDDAASILEDIFEREGIRMILGGSITRITRDEDGKTLHYTQGEKEESITVDEILVGAGRKPNVEGLNLESVGIKYDPITGVTVNDYLQTTNPKIYAAGDICLEHKFTHSADATARIVIQNALFFGRKKQSALTIPWCTYTDPEIAHVGLYGRECKERKIPFETIRIDFSSVDRAVTDGEEEGFLKVHVKKGSDTILGATMVARNAGDMISEITLAMVAGIGLKTISTVIHPYPTQAEAIRKAGDEYNRKRFTPFLQKVFKKYLSIIR
jgi:pyruvate/2-oxoglutarate dehydrogenase complex dihydrolipoamide dehydrogenase (E3) component